jgi:hypothetical protein
MPITYPDIYRIKNQMSTRTWNETKAALNSDSITEGTVIYNYKLSKRGVVNSNNVIIWDDDLSNA